MGVGEWEGSRLDPGWEALGGGEQVEAVGGGGRGVEIQVRDQPAEKSLTWLSLARRGAQGLS